MERVDASPGVYTFPVFEKTRKYNTYIYIYIHTYLSGTKYLYTIYAIRERECAVR